MNLSFYKTLNDEQRRYADLIATRAKAAGVPPELAVAVAYRESRLNPSVARGDAGEVGIMQVKPTTGKELGFAMPDLQNPERNIDAGVAYLKKSLDAAEGNQKLAAVGYNAGINHPFFSGAKLPESTKKYVEDIIAFGGTVGEMPAATAPATAAPTADQTGEVDPAIEMEKRLATAKAEQEQRMAQLGGAGVGAAVAAKRGAQDVGRALSGAIERRVGDVVSRMSGAPGVMPGQDEISRILQGTTQDGATGRARSTGFNIETAQQAARAKEAERLFGALQQSGTVSQTAPQVLANAPGLTATPSGVVVPRSVNIPPTTAPVKPSGLEQVTRMFASMASPVARMASTTARYLAPPLALAGAAGEGAQFVQEARKPELDYPQMLLSGLGALGGTMAAFGGAPLGVPMALTAPVGRDILSKFREQQRLAQINPPAPPSETEVEQASKPAFGVYPRPATRRGLEGSPLDLYRAGGY